MALSNAVLARLAIRMGIRDIDEWKAALRGEFAEVGIDLPPRDGIRSCRDCGGEGLSNVSGFVQLCPACKGTGKRITEEP